MKRILHAHYEKIILAAFLIVFASMLFYQVTVVQEVQNKQVENIINRKDIESDYKQIDFSGDKAYRIETIFSENLSLDFTAGRTVASTEMMTPTSLAECIYCHSLIAADSYPAIGQTKNGKCPACGKALAPRVKIDENELFGKADNNLNSIPDEWEEKYNLTSFESDSDEDQDGFTLAQEFKANTDPLNPLSHPKYVSMLYVSSIREQVIRGLELKSVDNSKPNKKDWTLTFDVLRNNRKKTEFCQFGVGTFKNDNVDYRVIDILIDEQTTDPIVYLERIGRPGRIECRLRKSVKDPFPRVILYDSLRQRTISTIVGRTIKLGTGRTGEETYTVLSANAAEVQAVLQETGEGEEKVSYTLQRRPQEEKSGAARGAQSTSRTGAAASDSTPFLSIK